MHALHAINYLSQGGYPIDMTVIREPISSFYQTRDGRWIFISGPYPHLRDGLLRLLRCANDRSSIGTAIAEWETQDLENAIAEQGLCGAMLRSPEEWRLYPQGQAIAVQPVIEIEKIANSPPVPLATADRPLRDVRVLDMSHVICGPMVGRTIAEQGADVLRITSPQCPFLRPILHDAGHGKRNAFLDINSEADALRLKGLIKNADIMVDSFRPGSLARRGFAPQRIAETHKGIIYVSVSCYRGSWSLGPAKRLSTARADLHRHCLP
jgi:CoA-transferase family III